MNWDEYITLFHKLNLNLVAFKRLYECDQEMLKLVNAAIEIERPWVGLTGDDIAEVWQGGEMVLPWDMERTLAIEAKLKEKNA